VAKYGSNSVVVTFGGTDMSQHTQTINGLSVESIMEESHTFGDAWFESLATGLKKFSDITLGGMYDDTATTGPDAKYSVTASGPSTSTTALVITYGGTKTTSANVFIKKYDRMLVRGAIHKYTVVLTPTGTVTEA
jgi:hypothetical protein